MFVIMKNKIFILLSFILSIHISAQTTTVNYTESTDDFPNPERGFYRYAGTHSDSYSLLNASTLASYRNLHTPPSASYSIYSTLVYRIFYLDDFTNSAISSTYLDNVQADFDAARTAGVKLIVRFAYTNDIDGSTCASWICPPYGDASKTWVLHHIGQLQPYLNNNKDVIALVQMGFIGVWGEGYYTDYFGDASQSPYILTTTNWEDRNEVLNTYLSAVPSDRMIQVRYPQQKQKTVYGTSAPTNSAPVNAASAYNGTALSRIGHHNDCFLASHTDFGTYTNYGPPSSFADTTNLKPYLENDSRYVVVGGETCSEYLPFDNCDTDGGYADTELERFHYSFLNSQYNNSVNNGWIGSCLDDIKKRLGYRFVLIDGTYSNEAQTGQIVSININLDNVGYAAPFNPRGVEIILRNSLSGDVFFAEIDEDPRFWLPGSHNVSTNLCIPNDMPLGNYDLLLNLPDPEYSLYSRSEYSIRVANDGVWEASTGYNDLGHSISINSSASQSACTTETSFQEESSFLPVELVRFNIKKQNNQTVICSWQTYSEINNKGFYLERSIDGRNFENITWINGQGNSSEVNYYEYIDYNLSSNKYYYRLKQEDFDGTFNYSNIKIIHLENENLFEVFPNPVQDYINIKNINSEKIKISIFSSSGKIHFYKESSSSLENIDLSHLALGVYFLKIEDNNQRLYYKKIIKTKH